MSKFFIILSNNTIEVNLVEAMDRDKFAFENIQTPQGLETESPAGRIAAQLQEKATRMVLRRR